MHHDTPTPANDELVWLQRAAAQGVWIAPMVVVGAHVEADFYRWNNLHTQVQALLSPLSEADPDEDDVAEVVADLQRLVLEHALLDAVVDTFYEQLQVLPTRVRVRHPGDAGATALRGRPALLSVKRLWASAWTLENIMQRTRAGSGWWPTARPVLVHSDAMEEDATLARAASAALGEPVRAWRDNEGRLIRLALGEPARD